MSHPRLTVAAIVRDEKERIFGMMRSAREIADEFVIVDTGSTDGTQLEARKFGARVFEHPWTDSFAEARNRSLEHARGEWILVLDADDRLTPRGVAMVRTAINWPIDSSHPRLTGYAFNIDERRLDGSLIGIAASSGRLFPNRPALQYRGRVHEEVLYHGDRAKTRWGLLPGVHIVHRGYDPSLMPEKYERNLRLLRMQLVEKPRDVYTLFHMAMTYRSNGDLASAYDWAQDCMAADDEAYDLLREHRLQLGEIIKRGGAHAAA